MKQHIKTVKEFIALRYVFGNGHNAMRESLDEVVKAAERYEFLRTLTPQDFKQLWQRNISGEGFFDDLVDSLVKARNK